VEIPRSAMVEKIKVIEITVDEMPITPGEVILDRNNQKTYPKKISIILSK
jgi:hypothetical protein